MSIIPSLPVNLTNGTLGDANQVMANFNAIVSDVNSNAAASGVNADITALTALSTPLTPTQGGSSVYTGSDSGSANAYIVSTPTPIGFTLRAGNTVIFIPSFTNTGAATLSVAGTAATAIMRVTAIGLQPLVGKEIVLNQQAMVTFDGTQYVLQVSASPSISAQFVQNYLSGLTLSTAGSSGTFGIAAGEAADSTNVSLMLLLSSFTKTTASWVVGTGNGGLDTGAIANNTWYHVYLIQRVDTGLVDIVFSLGQISPQVLPTNYTLYRRVGSMRTDSSGHWLLFTQTGDTFILSVGVADLTGGTQTTRTNVTLTTPLGIVVNALFRGVVNTSSASSNFVIFTSLQESDQVPGNNICDLATPSTGGVQGGSFSRFTDTASRIAYRETNGAGTVAINTYGWIDRRGRDG